MTSSTEGGRSHGEPPRDGGPDEAAHYLHGAISDLAKIAHRHGHHMLSHLLDMALMEADEIMRLRGNPGSSSGH